MAYFSNGTEGRLYEERYCNQCVHQEQKHGCPVWLLHLIWNYEQNSDAVKECALQVLIPRDGILNLECSMFIEKGDIRMNHTYTEDQLCQLMIGVIELRDEYQDKHNQPRDLATLSAIRDTLESLDVKQEGDVK